jgi:hypothetical protein
MARPKKIIDPMCEPNDLSVEFVPVYISKADFQKKKSEVQTLIARTLISSQKRGRPSEQDIEELDHAA